MSAPITLTDIGELHTMEGPPVRRGAQMHDTGVRKNAHLTIRNGKIDSASAVDTLSVGGRIVTPGLVDCHTHLVWAGNRADEYSMRCAGKTYQEIAEAGGGILSTMRAVRDADADELAAGLESRSTISLSFGTTTIEIKASYGLSMQGCKKELDACAKTTKKVAQKTAFTFMGAHAFPPDISRENFFELLIEELLPMASKHAARPRFNDVFCEKGYFTVQESERILLAGVKLGLIPKIHSDEFDAIGGTEMACSIGAASCDHLLASGEAQVQALAESETIAVAMPATAFFLDKPYADGRKFVDGGCALALGTDWNPGSSMVPSMPFVIGLAVSRMGLTPEEALCAATVNSAAAIREPAGKLEPGCDADFCVWPCSTLRELIYEFAYIKPDAVFIRGELAAGKI